MKLSTLLQLRSNHMVLSLLNNASMPEIMMMVTCCNLMMMLCKENRIVPIEDSNSKAFVAKDSQGEIDWTKEFDDDPVTFAMVALNGIEEDDWSIEIDADHVDIGQDGLGMFDWSEEVDNAPVALALMATSSTDSSNSKVPYCSNCSKSYKKLLNDYQTERDNFQRARLEIQGYQLSLESLEVIIRTHEKNEYAWGDKYEQMEYDLKMRDWKLGEKQKELDNVIKERDELKEKLEKWSNATLLQTEILNKQKVLNDKTCIGFGVEYSSSEESNNSSGDETLTGPLYENFKREKISTRHSTSTHSDDLIKNKEQTQNTVKSNIDRNKVIIEDWVDSDDEEAPLRLLVMITKEEESLEMEPSASWHRSFENVCYVKELKLNLYLIVDENLVLLRAPRKNDVYSLNLKSITSSGEVTCLVTKASEDEAILWHGRLWHVNFKNINNVVKVHTDDNVADLLTKGFDLASIDFERRFDAFLKGSTAREELRTEPSMKEVEDEAGPSTFQDESDEFIQDDTLIADLLVNISKSRRGAGITIPGNIPEQERPKSPTLIIDPKDKGKGIMKEEPKKKKLTLQQLRAAETANDEEFARRVAAEWEEEEERKRLAGLERLQAELEDNEMIAAEVQRTERENFTEEQKAKFLVETIAAQRRFRAEQQAALRRSKPPTIPQLRNQMMKYIRNVKRFNDEFVAIGSTEDEQAIKEMNVKAEEPSKKRKGTIRKMKSSRIIKKRRIQKTDDELKGFSKWDFIVFQELYRILEHSTILNEVLHFIGQGAYTGMGEWDNDTYVGRTKVSTYKRTYAKDVRA
ncbi:ribonuclease H-like domain-containing protein [Tanacetum coccineum]